MPKRNWANGQAGNTPLDADRMNALETDLDAAMVALARDPEALFAGAITRNADGAPTSAVVKWPDGVDGTYSGVASQSFPGSVNSYTITRTTNAGTVTFTQPNVTRDGITGLITNRPPITVS